KNEAIYLRNIVLSSAPSSRQKEVDLLKAEGEAVKRDIEVLVSMSNVEDQKLRVEQLITANNAFNKYKDEILQLTLEGKNEEAVLLISEQSRALHDEFFETISALTSKFEDQTTNSLNQVPKVFQKNLFWGSSLVL